MPLTVTDVIDKFENPSNEETKLQYGNVYEVPDHTGEGRRYAVLIQVGMKKLMLFGINDEWYGRWSVSTNRLNDEVHWAHTPAPPGWRFIERLTSLMLK